MYSFTGPPSVGAPTAASADEFDDFPLIVDPKQRPALNGRICGTVTDWKGKFGWLASDTPLAHPEARLKGGKIYFSQEEVLEVISGVGAHVSFYVYADGSGLGALKVVPADSATAKKKIARGKAAAKPKAKATPGRKRVSQDQLQGKVKSWRGGFGFLTPSSPVDHPLFTGSLFLHGNDVSDPAKLKEGVSVTFYLYSDPQGLGAEECEITDEVDEPSGGDMPVTPAASSSDASGLLKAKPKAAAGSGGIMIATAKASAKSGGSAGVMKATPKASAAVKAAGDPDLAKKMADNPDLARQLSAWMFDPGG